MTPASTVQVPPIDLSVYRTRLAGITPLQQQGRVVQVIGLTIEAEGISPQLGEFCRIDTASGSIAAEVVGFRKSHSLIMPLGEMEGVQPGSRVTATRSLFQAPVGPGLLGRVLDGLGNPIDGKGPLRAEKRVPLSNPAPHPLERRAIEEPMGTGVRAIDGLMPVGKGQRMGIFAGSGVGKSSLLGMIARNAAADVNVIALIGERGREVREFIEKSLGEEGLARSVIVVSTSDVAPLIRIKGAWVATAIAEYFRDQMGLDVNFMMDSVTRFAMAQREVGLAVGEPPAMKAYPPSVFALLPRLMERTGAGVSGTITAFYTVLVEGDDFNEPISDAVRGILDGHMMLTRSLAAENHYPAIDVLHSASRLISQLATPAHQQAAGLLREALAVYEDAKDLVNIGAYVAGSNPRIDAALALLPHIRSFLRQDVNTPTGYTEAVDRLQGLFDGRTELGGEE
ncbi:MAG: FliI/YscN family ATPase [Caldilineaceae bacterium]|nr:FliI/YscN family ATPase [Caldilineaceae bacterium]